MQFFGTYVFVFSYWPCCASVGQCQGQAERESACARHPLQLSPIAPHIAVPGRSPRGSHSIFLHPRTGFCNKMPFPTRPLQPSSLGRGPLPPGEEPLQWVTNQNLCQAMRQLVSLLKQADSVFGDLEVRGEGCVVTVIGRVLFGDESNSCAQPENQTPGLKGRRTQLGGRDYS